MNESALTALLGPVVTRCGLELDAVEVRRAGRRALVRISLDGDGPQGGGPTLDQVTQATTAISKALDAAPAVTGDAPYVLEVGSRGVHRPLTRPAHYRRNAGRLLSVERADGSALTGRIRSADEGAVVVDVDGVEREVPYDTIRRAVVQAELRALPDVTTDVGEQGEE